MHPDLNNSRREEVCKDFIKALEDCHKTWKFWTGGCGDIKNDLNLCLRAERISRQRKNLEKGRERQARLDSRLKESRSQSQSQSQSQS